MLTPPIFAFVPIAMAVVAAVAAVATAASAAYGAYSSYQMGKAQERIANFNAKVKERNAALEREQSGARQAAEARERERILSRQRSAYAAAGLDVSQGTPLMMEAAQDVELKLSSAENRWRSEVASRNLETGAEIDRLEGRMARYGAKQKAVGTLLSGVADTSNSILGSMKSGAFGGGGGGG